MICPCQVDRLNIIGVGLFLIYRFSLKKGNDFDTMSNKEDESFTEEDFAELAITPLMSSEKNRKDVILESIKLSNIERSISAKKTMAMLYTLADKFLTGNDLKEVKEAVIVTRIGQMIFDDGVDRGKELGREEERKLMAALIPKLLQEKRFDDIRRVTEDEEFRKRLMKEFNIA